MKLKLLAAAAIAVASMGVVAAAHAYGSVQCHRVCTYEVRGKCVMPKLVCEPVAKSSPLQRQPIR